MGSNEHTTHLFSPTLRTPEFAQSSAQRFTAAYLARIATHCMQSYALFHKSHLLFHASQLHCITVSPGISVLLPQRTFPVQLMPTKRNLSECCASEGHAQKQCLNSLTRAWACVTKDAKHKMFSLFSRHGRILGWFQTGQIALSTWKTSEVCWNTCSFELARVMVSSSDFPSYLIAASNDLQGFLPHVSYNRELPIWPCVTWTRMRNKSSHGLRARLKFPWAVTTGSCLR